MLSQIDVRAVLTVLADFLVDIPAIHNDGLYTIRLSDLEYALTAPTDTWITEITVAAISEQLQDTLHN